MEDTLKNLLYQGLGVVAITREKVDKALAEMVERGKITREEGKKLFDEITEETHKAGEEFKANSKENIREWIEKSGIPSRSEFEALKARVEALEKEKAAASEA